MLVTPTVHLNGTSRDELLSQARKAHEAATAMLEALGRAAPHPRDYYPQGDAAFNVARDLHEQRLRKVREVADEMLSLAMAIQESGR